MTMTAPDARALKQVQCHARCHQPLVLVTMQTQVKRAQSCVTSVECKCHMPRLER